MVVARGGGCLMRLNPGLDVDDVLEAVRASRKDLWAEIRWYGGWRRDVVSGGGSLWWMFDAVVT